LGNDVIRLATQVEKDVRAIATQADKLALAVAAQINQSAKVTADVSALNTAVIAMASGIASGSISVADINAAIAAEKQLLNALGTSITPQIRQAINSLDKDLTNLRNGVMQIAGVVHNTIGGVERTILKLAHSVASTATPTVVADLKALNSALAIVAIDSAL